MANEAGRRLEIRILGPLEVTDGPRLLELGGLRQRALLARLAVAANRVVAVESLLDELWGPQAQAAARQALQAQASRLRRVLGDADRVVARAPGYVLRLDPGELDATRFESLLVQARAAADEGDLSTAALRWAEAEGLWRGPALAEFADAAFAQAEAARLGELRRGAIEARIDAELDLGRHDHVVAELEALVGANPYRERLWAQLMLALYRSGRQADALAAYQRLRHLLGQELGIAPSPELVRLEEAVLLQKPELDWVPPLDAPRHASEPAGASPAPPHNLPRPRSSFIGRHRELDELDKLLEAHGLVTVVGPGGVGKTRLAVEVGRRVGARFPDGTWLVELAALTDPSLVPNAMATAIGLEEEPGRAALDTLVDATASRRALILLDNCEHVIEAAAALADSLLGASATLTVLATSREPLRIEGEVVWRPQALPVPPEGVAAAQEALRFDAVRLFCERANDQGALGLDADNAAPVAELCRRLDGIPLAIELAAARAGALAPEQMLAHLEDRFALLNQGRRTALPRHQTLEAAIDWSYDLLAPAEQVVFRRLSVFAGSFTPEAAEHICGGGGAQPGATFDLLGALGDKSFLLRDEARGPNRFRTLDTLRDYGKRRLAASGELDPIHDRLLEWELGLGKAGEGQVTPREQQKWMRSIEDELDNIRAVLAWAGAGHDQVRALELAVALLRYWEVHGVNEGRQRTEELLEAGGSIPPDLRVQALTVVGTLAAHQGDHERVRSTYESSLAHAQQLSLTEGVERSILGLGHVAYMQGDYEASRRLCDESLELAKQLGDLRGQAASLHVLGRVAQFQSRDADAERLLQESLEVRLRMGDEDWIATGLGALGDLAFWRQDFAVARTYCQRSIELADAARSTHQRAWATNLLGTLDLAEGDSESAEMHLQTSLDLFRQLGDRSCTARALQRLSQLERHRGNHRDALLLAGESLHLNTTTHQKVSAIECLEQIAGSLIDAGDHADGVRVFGCCDHVRATLEASISSMNRAMRDRDLNVAHGAIGPDEYLRAWEAGHMMSLEDGARYAFALIEP